MATEINVDTTKKSPLIDEDDDNNDIFKMNDDLDHESTKLAEKETEETIPSGYIPIRLVSNGRVAGIPSVLHFRDYSASESLDLVTPDDEDKPKAIAEVLRRMCLEDFDIKELPVQDVLVILYTLHATFISNTVTKTIYLDDDLPDDTIDDESNTEEVDISISSLRVQYLGLDINDEELDKKIKVPFKIIDHKTNKTVQFKLVTLGDSILAKSYCDNFFIKDVHKFLPLKKDLSKINSIKDEKIAKEKMEEYLTDHYEECKDYEKFMITYTAMLGKVMQALQIVSYDGKQLDSLDEKWDIYVHHLSSSIWTEYDNLMSQYPYGLDENVEVYSNKLQKKLNKKIGFQLSDFLSATRTKDNDRYSVLFD